MDYRSDHRATGLVCTCHSCVLYHTESPSSSSFIYVLLLLITRRYLTRDSDVTFASVCSPSLRPVLVLYQTSVDRPTCIIQYFTPSGRVIVVVFEPLGISKSALNRGRKKLCFLEPRPPKCFPLCSALRMASLDYHASIGANTP